MATVREVIQRDLGRPVEGVVKVFDEAALADELREYVVTDKIEEELKRIFDTFTQVSETLRRGGGARDVVGMWISGFFGSGKSHFAKVLGHLLLEHATRRRLRRLVPRRLRQTSLRHPAGRRSAAAARGSEARHPGPHHRLRDQEPAIAEQPQLGGRDPPLGVLPADRARRELRRRPHRAAPAAGAACSTRWRTPTRPSSVSLGRARRGATTS